MFDSITIYTSLAKNHALLKTKALAYFWKCTRVFFVIPNVWQEYPTKLPGFSKWNSEKAGCSFSRSLKFFLIYLLALLIKLVGCFTISTILSSLFLENRARVW